MPFSSSPNFSLNRGRLPLHLGVLRLITILTTLATLMQLVVPIVARVIFNAGRVSYPNEYHSLWDPILPWPVLSVPAWLTITTGLVAIGCASAYLLLGKHYVEGDITYITAITLLSSYVTIFIAGFEPDPTGIFRSAEPNSYPIGWHWVVAPFSIIMIVSTIVSAIRVKRFRIERDKQRKQRMAARAAARSAGRP